ncbi:small multidrug resistance protein [Paenibacillus vortex V453]|jgi:paired small multidrug resistance pump|uniref:Transporter n=2 Tax=Paenibacillus TaxID=44249 RepID=A0A163IAD5_9BACL|nr:MULTISPECIES: multidrug efflux SMR transporter [Paenibacillus]ANA79841.1 transporter [Paenibacillus glucanolyticus]AVV56134.1 QacE family quaternary ammonium compound efflux SMR transporter [Paenibacillus glucanolyticus]AWP30671.1 QacE family quaternary ammonium compound efflux SMR transporter [Paenibacillus sp. Cedars]EFU38078.1 small multidrug resistance protein [Paenibacillus vortex V453]ETT38219.1 small multidrug resistance protein [Paenibacillus sp. FSL R5-808]
MAWVALIFAGLFEIGGVIGIKGVSQRKGWHYTLILALSFGISFSLLSYAMTVLPMGTAYAIWTGIGTAGGAMVGMFLFGEPKDWRRVVFISMILCSAVGLKLIS